MHALQTKLVLGLREYRSLHLSQSRGSVPHNALILPPALRLVPAWVLGAVRCAALRLSVREVSNVSTCPSAARYVFAPAHCACSAASPAPGV